MLRHLGIHGLISQCEEVDPSDVSALVAAVGRAVKLYGTPTYYKMVKAGMAQDLSWKVLINLLETMFSNLNKIMAYVHCKPMDKTPIIREPHTYLHTDNTYKCGTPTLPTYAMIFCSGKKCGNINQEE